MPQALASTPLSRARRALAASSIGDLRKLTVEKQGDELKITGKVESFYHKQLAQELLLAEVEDLEVINAIVVR